MNFTIGCANPDEATQALYAECGLTLKPLDMSWSNKDDIVEKLSGLNCWINVGQVCDADMLRRLSPSLKMVCRSGIGYDQIDIGEAERLGICVSNTAGSMDASVGETALILILEAMRRTFLYNRRLAVDGLSTRDIVGSDLEGKTVGLVGFGGIARRLARYLRGFECRLLTYDVFKDVRAAAEYGVQYVALEDLAAMSDVISIHCPLLESTHHLIGRDFLSRMKPTAVLVNTARGPIVDEQALLEALKSGVIAGAGLDVYENEPVDPAYELPKLENVYALPHIGSFSVESRRLTMLQAADNILDFTEGHTPRNCLNPGYAKNKR